MKKIRLALSLLFLLCSTSFFNIAPAQQAPATTPATAAVTKPTEAMVAMRDGVKLSTSIYMPEGKGPFPVVLIRTPYGKGTQAIGYAAWTQRGFALVTQDVRGKGTSEG